VKSVRTPATVAWAAILGALAACLAQCADEPKPHCIVTPGPFAVRLLEQSRSAACDATFGPESFNADPRVGIGAYFVRDSQGQPDYDRGSIALRTAEVTNLVETYGIDNLTTDEKQLYSLGDFTGAIADDNDFCTVPTTSQTHLVLPLIPAIPDDPATTEDEHTDALPPVDITLSWSNVQIYVTAAMDGTQFQATLEDARSTPAGGICTITYKALGVSAAVACAALDDNGDPIPGQTDPDACNPIPDPAAGRFTNNGISPLAKQSCDPVVAWCLIDGTSVPAIK
jgi:hypothetical protein